MKRVTIIHRYYWKPGRRSGGSQVYEMKTLHDLTDKKLEEKLTEMNQGFRTSIWTVLHDFKMDKKTDQREYFKYCIDAYYAPVHYDYESARYGKRMVDSMREEYSGLK